jgi:sigma-E factor negative regulatory protein RseC
MPDMDPAVQPLKSDTEAIEHEGEVVAVKGVIVQAKIRQISACAMCHAKGHCLITDSADKLIDLNNEGNIPLQIGDKIIVAIKHSVGLKAVFYAYVLPTILFISALLSLAHSMNEITAGAWALGLLVVYFFVLYLHRGELKKSLNFYIKSKIY